MPSIELNIKSSVNTDSIAEDTFSFADVTAPLLQQTGMERNGGVVNLWETETLLVPNSVNYVAPSGETITRLSDGTVQVEGQTAGIVSPYGVQIRDTIANVDDVILSTQAKTYITAVISGNAVTISEYYSKDNTLVTQNIPSDPLYPSHTLKPDAYLLPSGAAGLPTHRRTISFPGLSNTLYTSLSFVRTGRVDWYGVFKFALRQGDSVKILQENAPATILTIPTLLAGFNELNYLMVYQFENSSYFVNLAANSNNTSFICDSSFSSVTQNLACRYAVAQVHNNKSRMLISCNPIITAHNVKSIGYVGYYDFINFIATEQWIGPTNNGTADGYDQPTHYNTGYGYSEYVEKKTSLEQYFNFNAPAFDYNGTIQYNFHQTQNKALLYNYYGKFTNIYNLAPTTPFEFRVCWVNGVQSYLSVALWDSYPSDHLGVMLTEFGSFDDTYCPQVQYDNTILYKYGDSYYLIAIDVYTDSVIPQIQQISPVAFKINTISPINIVDLPSRTLLIGSCDYNGRMAYSSTAAVASVETRVVSTYTGKYSNGIDGGEKLLDITNPTSANIEVIGYRVDGLQNFQIDTYIAVPPGTGDPIYNFSTTATGAELVDPSKTDTPYIQNTVLPLALGDIYNLNVVTTVDSTIFYNTTNPLSVGSAIVAGTSIGYDGYTLGNDIPGHYVAFRLQGQQYLQDDNYIYKANVANDIYDGKKYIFAPAVGLRYVASSPTVIYFYSSYDNSLYTFTGGSTLDKGKRMNSLETILQGVFSIRDNTLLLNTAGTFVWARDGLFTLNPKKANQGGTIFMYETAEGIVILNNTYKWMYSYQDPTITPTPTNTTYSIVPLHFQTAFLGMENNQRCVITEWIITIYNEQKNKVSLILTLYIQDLDGKTKTQQKYINVNPQDYTEGNYARVSFKPEYPGCLRASLSVDTAEKVQLQSVVVTYQPAEQALVSGRRSR